MRVFKRVLTGGRKAFTLMEVNLAIFIMAIGVLAMASLYPLGYRENQQSQDDVRAAAMADLVLGQVKAALSSRNIKWDDWVSSIKAAVGRTPHGWRSYLDENKDWTPIRDPSTLASSVFLSLMQANEDHGSPQVKPGTGDGVLKYALVAQWGKRTIAESGGRTVRTEDDYSRVSVSFRATRRSRALFAQPIYYTEIHFQGDQKETAQ